MRKICGGFKNMKRKIEIYIRYPKDCPCRRVKAVPHTDGHFQYVCDMLDCDGEIINCMNDFVFPDECRLEEVD